MWTLKIQKIRMAIKVFALLCVLLDSIPLTHAQTSCKPEVEARTRGDVVLGGFFNIHVMSRDGRDCGAYVDLHAIERLEAALFAMDLINTVSFIPGVIFGMIAYDTCGLRHTATNKALRWLAERHYKNTKDTCAITPIHLGVIGPMYTGPAQDIAHLLTSAQMTQISYNAGGSSVDDRLQYPFLLRTGPNGKVASKVILDILEEYGWSDFIVVTGHGVDEQDRKRDLYQMAGSNGKCVMLEITVDPTISSFPIIAQQLQDAVWKGVTGVVVLLLPKPTEIFFTRIQDSLLAIPALSKLHWVMGLPFTDSVTYHNLKDAIKGMITFSIHPQPVRGFKEYFTSLTPAGNLRNPWFRKFWEQTFNCTVNKTCDEGHVMTYRQTYRQAAGVAQTVAAVYAYAQGFKDAHREVCGANYTGPCPALASISTQRLIKYLYNSTFVNLDGQLVAFDKNGDLAAPVFSVYNVQLDGVSYRLRKIGTWTEAKGLRLQSRFKVYDTSGRSSKLYPTSSCKIRCRCRNQLDDDKYGVMEDGDFIIQGIFDIHGGNALLQADPEGDHPLESECGSVPHPESMQAMEALYYALDLLNEDQDILPGIRLGAATFDSCRSPERAVRHTENLVSGTVQIPSFGRQGVRPIATIGGATSDVSKAVAKLLAPLRITQISYSASATELDDKGQYPYFLRTIGAGYNQVQVVIDLLQEFGWSYVKVIYSNNAFGNSAMRDFLDRLAGTEICVATQVQLNNFLTHNRVSMTNIVQYYLLEAYVEARVVVMFVTDKHAQKILESLRGLLGPGRTHDLIWLATDHWGSRTSITGRFEELIEGAITVGHASELIPDFLTYFQSKKPWTNERNPWFAEYWQHHFKCYLTGDFARIYNTSCTPAQTLETDYIAMATQVPLVIDAVYAAALGLHNLLADHCGLNYTGVCKNGLNNLEQLHTYIQQMHFYNGITKTAVTFDKLGSAPPQYIVNNFQQTSEGLYEYVKVGRWQVSTGLSIKPDDVFLTSHGGNATAVTASSVTSQCVHSHSQPCICSDSDVTDLKYELRYDRLTLLGYFPIHKFGVDGSHCSHFQSREGFETLMAFKYAIERINMDPQLLGNVTLGYMIFDTCSHPNTAKMAFNAFDRSLRFFSQPDTLPVITYVQAFVGGMEDDVSKTLHDASLRGQHLTQISPGAASESLADREKYSRFLRTTSPLGEKARAIVALLKILQWSYVGLVFDELATSQELPSLVERLVFENGLCIAAKLGLMEPHNKKAYDRVIKELLKAKGAVGVVVLAGREKTRSLLTAIERNEAIGKFVLIGTDEWGMDEQVFYGFDESARGSMAIVPAITDDIYFDLYMRRLTLSQSRYNPWVEEFWEHHFQCDLHYTGSADTNKKPSSSYGRACTGLETLENATFSSNPSVINTINAVYAYAHGISRLFKERCGGVVIPPCDMLRGGQRTSALVYGYISNVNFKGADGNLFKFSSNGDGPARFRVLNYQIERYSTLSKGYEQVGYWSSGALNLNNSLLQMYNADGSTVQVKSECPGTCNCSKSVLLDNALIPLKFTAHRTIWGILVLTISAMGILFSLVIIIFFILKVEHPVVDGTTCGVSVVLLMTITFIYLLNFAFMLSENRVTCGIRRFAFGLLYVTMVNVLLVRAALIWRMMSVSSSSSSPQPSTSTADSHYQKSLLYLHTHTTKPVGGALQCLGVLVLSGIQFVLGAQWLIIAPPDTESYLHNVSAEGHYPVYVVRWRCQHTRQGLVASSSYVFLLLAITFILSLRTLKARCFEHESIYILASVIGLVVTLFTWALVYVLADVEYANPATCVALTTSASVTLTFMFSRKMLQLTASSRARRRSPGSCSGGIADFTDPYDDQSYAVPSRKGKSVTIGVIPNPDNSGFTTIRPIFQSLTNCCIPLKGVCNGCSRPPTQFIPST